MMRTAYVSAVLGHMTRQRVVAGSTNGKVTKKAVKAALAVETGGGLPLEFISTDLYHRSGSWFTGAEAVKVWGPTTVELRDGSNLVAMIEYHPGKPASIK